MFQLSGFYRKRLGFRFSAGVVSKGFKGDPLGFVQQGGSVALHAASKLDLLRHLGLEPRIAC